MTMVLPPPTVMPPPTMPAVPGLPPRLRPIPPPPAAMTAQLGTDTEAPPADTPVVAADSVLLHIVRFVFVMLLTVLANAVILGLIWTMIALSRTGRRKRDIFLVAVPILGEILLIQTVWRYSARTVYWSARSDRPSRTLFS